MSSFTRGQLEAIKAGVSPAGAHKTITFDGGIESGALAGKATATTTLTGTNNDMVFTADANGVAGNGISVQYTASRMVAGQTAAVAHTTSKTIVVDLKTSAGVKATNTITDGNATNFSVGDTITVGTTVYTTKSTLTTIGDVKIGASADATLVSIAKTINGTGAAGTDMYTGTPAHTLVSSTETAVANAVTLTAKTVGVAGNLIALVVSAHGTAGGALFTLGEDVNQILSTAAEVKTAIEANTAAAALVDIANSGADDGSGVVTALAPTSLTLGSDGKVPLFTVTGEILCSLRGYIATNLAGANATLVHGVTGTTNMLIPILTCTTLVTPKGIDKSAAVVARGTALDATPKWRVADESVFATTATAATTAGVIHYILDYIDLSADNNSTVVAA